MVITTDVDIHGLLAALYQELTQTEAKHLGEAIVQAPYNHPREMGLLFMGFLCFYQPSSDGTAIQYISSSDTEYARQAMEGYDFDLHDYRVPLTATENSLVQAFTTGEPVTSSNWDTLRRPEVEEGVARMNQANSGIACSVAYPLVDKRGVLLYSYFQYNEALGESHQTFMQGYADLVSEVLGNAA